MEKCPKATGLWETKLNICVPVGLSLDENSKCPALGMLLDTTDGGSRVGKIRRCSRLQQGQKGGGEGGGGRGHYEAERVRTVQGFASFTAKESEKITELKRKHGYQKFLLAFHLNLNM